MDTFMSSFRYASCCDETRKSLAEWKADNPLHPSSIRARKEIDEMYDRLRAIAEKFDPSVIITGAQGNVTFIDIPAFAVHTIPLHSVPLYVRTVKERTSADMSVTPYYFNQYPFNNKENK